MSNCISFVFKIDAGEGTNVIVTQLKEENVSVSFAIVSSGVCCLQVEVYGNILDFQLMFNTWVTLPSAHLSQSHTIQHLPCLL